MIARDITITNRKGLHARAAAKLVHLSNRFESKILLHKDGIIVDGKSILGLLTLSANQGTTLKLTVDGSDETEASREIVDLFTARFGEEA